MIEKEKQKIKIVETKLSSKINMIEDSDLRAVDTNMIIKKLEENIKLREMDIEKRFKKDLMK